MVCVKMTYGPSIVGRKFQLVMDTISTECLQDEHEKNLKLKDYSKYNFIIRNHNFEMGIFSLQLSLSHTTDTSRKVLS